MNWATVIWPAAAGACLMLGGLHLAVWCRDRRAWASLVFAATSFSVAIHAFFELQMMLARSPAAFGAWLRWSHPWSFLAIAGTVVFVRLHFGTGRRWLGGLIIGLRLVALGLNFTAPVNLNYLEISGLRLVPFLGGEAAVAGEAVINRWMWLAQSAFALWLLYVVDASVTLWRRGAAEDRRRALVIGGGLALFIVLGAGHAVLSLNGLIASPLLASLAFGLMIFAMGWELGRDVLRAARLARDLHASERRLSLAAAAARVALWEWRAGRDAAWLSSAGGALHGVPPGQAPGFQHFAATLHPDDRPRVLDAVRRAVDERGAFAQEYRIILPDGAVRWIAGSGAARCLVRLGFFFRGPNSPETSRVQAGRPANGAGLKPTTSTSQHLLSCQPRLQPPPAVRRRGLATRCMSLSSPRRHLRTSPPHLRTSRRESSAITNWKSPSPASSSPSGRTWAAEPTTA